MQKDLIQNRGGFPNKMPKMINGGMVNGSNNGVFQNNFLLPKANGNTGGMMKTFYNSK